MRAALIPALLLLAGCVITTVPTTPGQYFERAWQPPSEARAQVLAVHGFGDHKATFAGLGEFLAQHRIAVHAFDLRGFGENVDFGIWPGTDVMVAQIAERAGELQRSAPDRPLYLLGDSMGGALVTVALARGQVEGIAGAVLVAPAVWGGETFNGFYRAMLGIARRVVPWLRLSSRGLPIRATDNVELLRERGRDPLFLKEPLVGMVAGLVDLMDEARLSARGLRARTLVLVGEKDQVVPPAAQRSFAGTIAAESCTLLQYPEGWHVLLHDLQRQRVFDDILAWLDGGVPAGSDKSACADKAS